MKITTMGVDLAKNIFQVHGVNEYGKVEVRKQIKIPAASCGESNPKRLKRAEMSAYFAHLPPCLMGMEACGSAHHWARTLWPHTIKLMAPQFVKHYVKINKNDRADV